MMKLYLINGFHMTEWPFICKHFSSFGMDHIFSIHSWWAIKLLYILSDSKQHFSYINESPHDKTNKMACEPSEDSVRPVWSESLLSAWRKLGSLATHWAHSENSDQTGQMHRLIRVFAGITCHFVGFITRRLICISSQNKMIILRSGYQRFSFATRIQCTFLVYSIHIYFDLGSEVGLSVPDHCLCFYLTP